MISYIQQLISGHNTSSQLPTLRICRYCIIFQTNLFVDWCDENIGRPECAMRYTCYNPTRPILPNAAVEPEYHSDSLPKNFTPRHFCMDKKLTYKDALPTYGDHRPLWPKFGEYV